MHEAPYWSHGRAGRMARTACITLVSVTVCGAAGIAAGLAVGEHGADNPRLPHSAQPGDGAVLVGTGVALLVAMLMRIGYVLLERRRKPTKKYSTRYSHGLTSQQYLRTLGSFALAMVALCCLGLWLRHRYG
jgi:hypothetical protein